MSGEQQQPLRLAVGSDSAGVSYEMKIHHDLLKDPRIVSVIDVGVGDTADHTAYPHTPPSMQ
jgi:ribose 5-phosphate isomerase B